MLRATAPPLGAGTGATRSHAQRPASGTSMARIHPLPVASTGAAWKASERKASRPSTHGLRPGSNKELDEEVSRLGSKAFQSEAGSSGSARCGPPPAETPNRFRQPAWMTNPAWPATGFQEPACCQSGTAAKPKLEATTARTKPPTALLRERHRLCRANIRPRRSLKSLLTPAPCLPDLPGPCV